MKFLRPVEHQDKWYNIFVIHQNRVRHGATNYIPESFIPGFIDLVIWGHEHECKPEADQLNNNADSDDKCSWVIQPGSSVATQLQPGEMKEKHTFILSIFERKFKLKKFKLKTVRPFVLDNVCSSDILKGKCRNIEQTVETYLEARIKELIREANDQLSGHEVIFNQRLIPFHFFNFSCCYFLGPTHRSPHPSSPHSPG